MRRGFVRVHPSVWRVRARGPCNRCTLGGGETSLEDPETAGVGARCAGDEDCGADLECVTEIDGGYCGRRDCESNADCPDESSCVAGSDFNDCARPCDAASDCTFCRDPESETSCASDVTFVEDGTSGSVCVVG